MKNTCREQTREEWLTDEITNWLKYGGFRPDEESLEDGFQNFLDSKQKLRYTSPLFTESDENIMYRVACQYCFQNQYEIWNT